MRFLKWTLVIVVLFAAFLVGNSAGLFTVSLAQTSFEDEFSFSLINDQDLRNRTVRLRYVDDLDRPYTVPGRIGSGEELWIDAELVRLEFEGKLWVPLYKEGSCPYEVRLQARGLDIHGKMVGRVDVRSLGIHPLRALKEDVRERIFIQVCENVRERARP